MTLNELVKLTMLWTTGPRIIQTRNEKKTYQYFLVLVVKSTLSELPFYLLFVVGIQEWRGCKSPKPGYVPWRPCPRTRAVTDAGSYLTECQVEWIWEACWKYEDAVPHNGTEQYLTSCDKNFPEADAVLRYSYKCIQGFRHTLGKFLAPDKVLFCSYKNIDIFLFLQENVCCGYSLDIPRWGTSNEYPQHTFLWKNKKNINLDTTIIWSYEKPASPIVEQ